MDYFLSWHVQESPDLNSFGQLAWLFFQRLSSGAKIFYSSLFTEGDWNLSESIIPITHTWAEPTWMQIQLASTHPI